VRDKLGRRRSTTVVCLTDRQALSTARFCLAGQLATADTCLYVYSYYSIDNQDRRQGLGLQSGSGLATVW